MARAGMQALASAFAGGELKTSQQPDRCGCGDGSMRHPLEKLWRTASCGDAFYLPRLLANVSGTSRN